MRFKGEGRGNPVNITLLSAAVLGIFYRGYYLIILNLESSTVVRERKGSS